ncbi:MAG: metalloregulator ArsR/SmtB family transcription factor [Hyphomicrobiales bacterium]|nr:metalloregulator ArsR/SmtB family transcription factor [Hyphomicrobiales bacterium]
METNSAVRALAALAQDHRLAIFRRLAVQGPSGMAAGDIAKAVGISPTSVSFHLKELDRAGLVVATRQGRFIRYAIHVDQMRQLLEFLTEDCCGGHPELCGGDFSKRKDFCREERE